MTDEGTTEEITQGLEQLDLPKINNKATKKNEGS